MKVPARIEDFFRGTIALMIGGCLILLSWVGYSSYEIPFWFSIFPFLLGLLLVIFGSLQIIIPEMFEEKRSRGKK